MVVEANWYSCNVKVISRSGTRTAIGAAAYATGTCLYDRELEASPNYEPSDFRRKGGVEQWFISARDTAPEWAYDVEDLCNEAQAHDTRKNSCMMRVARFSLPHWADAAGREHITREVAGYLVERYGVAVIAAIHAPDRHGDDRNWHTHLVFTTRQVDENGFGAKTRVLDEKKTGPQEITRIREAVATIINDYMEEAGADERVDHRSYKDRGIEYKPTIHMGSAANALERKGIRTERGDRNREIKESNRKIDQLLNELKGVQAEISRELEKDFLEPEEKPVTEIENPSFPTAQEELALSWEEQKAAAQDSFESEIVKAYESQIREQGEVSEYGLGRNWFDRTLVMFENIYYDTIDQVKGFWERHIVNRGRDRDRSVWRDDPDSTPDREDEPDLGR